MVLYECKWCGITTHLKGNYDQHLNTNKHKRNIEICKTIENNKTLNIVSSNEPKKSSNEHKKSSNEHKKSTNEHKKSSNEHKNILNDPKIYCVHCGLIVKTKAILSRHKKYYCKVLKKIDENFILKDKISKLEKERDHERKEYEREKKDLYKKIDELISKVGNTYNHNIILNNYGKEDLSHITDKFKTDLLKAPFMMIPKMIEAVHFNENKPENNNILLKNKKENRLQVYRDNKWVYKNKKDVISELMDSNYFNLDSHYDNNTSNLNNYIQGNYLKFREYMSHGDKEFVEKLKDECEMVLLNNRE